MSTVSVVVGNPKPRSRTYQAAVLVAEKLNDKPPDLVVDLVDLGAALLDGDMRQSVAPEVFLKPVLVDLGHRQRSRSSPLAAPATSSSTGRRLTSCGSSSGHRTPASSCMTTVGRPERSL
jgi:hypothetical protein